MKDLFFDIQINSQPTETTCGPTCLHSIYQYHDEKLSLKDLIDDITYLDSGGTLGVHLGTNALKRGFSVDIYTHNLNVFDPTWFGLEKNDLVAKLENQGRSKPDLKVAETSKFYIDFLNSGGFIKFSELKPEFIYKVLQESGPVICGLSATYLYMSKRETNDTCEYDDINGYPQGHFVILSGISGDLSMVEITDPLQMNPFSKNQKYLVRTQHLLNAILIGVITYDSNFIVFSKEQE